LNKEYIGTNKKTNTILVITIILTALFVVLAGLLIFFYHRLLWTLTLNFNIIYFIWTLLAAANVGLFVIILSIILVKRTPNKNKTLFIPPSLVVFLAVFSLSFGLFDRVSFNSHYTFSQEKWASATNNERSVYVDSFLKMYDLYTFDDAQIVEYLGEPDIKETFELETFPPQFGGYAYYYDLGFVRDFIDPSYLEIKTNQYAIVYHYGIYSS